MAASSSSESESVRLLWGPFDGEEILPLGHAVVVMPWSPTRVARYVRVRVRLVREDLTEVVEDRYLWQGYEKVAL